MNGELVLKEDVRFIRIFSCHEGLNSAPICDTILSADIADQLKAERKAERRQEKENEVLNNHTISYMKTSSFSGPLHPERIVNSEGLLPRCLS